MRRAALAGVAALSIAGGSLALAAVMPIGAVLAQDTDSPTTTALGPPPTAPGHPKAKSAREGFVKRGLTLRFSENVVNYLAKIGFDERYGARPLQRALEDHILKPLANWLLRNKAENARLEVDFDVKIIVKKV